MSLSVSELVARLRRSVEQGVGEAEVCGEIGSCKTAASGHIYFTLKDASAQLQCVLYRFQALSSRVRLREGMQVELSGRATVWEGRGSLQFIVSRVKEAGLGSLQQQFEALKARLQAEGLFDPERKKALPRFPQSVGLITSAAGAVIQDMRHRLSSRAPWMQAWLYPVAVQGKGAEEQIAEAIRRWNDPAAGLPSVDYLIIARGGGSLEDLWCFNEESLARAIAASRLPVVSAVGHETDFTIADFVADLRAPTPTAAIELTTPDGAALDDALSKTESALRLRLRRALETARLRLQAAARGKLERPLEAIGPFSQRLDLLDEQLHRLAARQLEQRSHRLSLLAVGLSAGRTTERLGLAAARLSALEQQLHASAETRVLRARATVDGLAARLTIADPGNALARGFALVRRSDGSLARDSEALSPGDALRITLARGEVDATVTASHP